MSNDIKYEYLSPNVRRLSCPNGCYMNYPAKYCPNCGTETSGKVVDVTNYNRY